MEDKDSKPASSENPTFLPPAPFNHLAWHIDGALERYCAKRRPDHRKQRTGLRRGAAGRRAGVSVPASSWRRTLFAAQKPAVGFHYRLQHDQRLRISRTRWRTDASGDEERRQRWPTRTQGLHPPIIEVLGRTFRDIKKYGRKRFEHWPIRSGKSSSSGIFCTSSITTCCRFHFSPATSARIHAHGNLRIGPTDVALPSTGSSRAETRRHEILFDFDGSLRRNGRKRHHAGLARCG